MAANFGFTAETDVYVKMESKASLVTRAATSPLSITSLSTVDTLGEDSSSPEVFVDIELERNGARHQPVQRYCYALKHTNRINDFEMEIIARDPTRNIGGDCIWMKNILRLNFDSLTDDQRLIWLYARFEALTQLLQDMGNSLKNIRTGYGTISRADLVTIWNSEHQRFFPGTDFFKIGEPTLKIPPMSTFIRREELYYFGIAESPYDAVSICNRRYSDGIEDTLASAIILDHISPLKEDYGTRFIFYTKFECSTPDETPNFINIRNALFGSWLHELPVRIVRGYNADSKYAPVWGYRYDGLYRIIEAYSDNDEAGKRVWVFIFTACNDSLQLPVYTFKESDNLDLLCLADAEHRGILLNHIYNRAKSTAANKTRPGDDLKVVDVVFEGKRIFTIAIPYFIQAKNRRTKNGTQTPLLVNFSIIYQYIRELCESTNIARSWLEGPVKLYEEAKRDEKNPLNKAQGANCNPLDAKARGDEKDAKGRVWWAYGGFLPMLLVIQRVEPKIYVSHGKFRRTGKERVINKKHAYVKKIPINVEMAKAMSRPFFPQSDADSIWTYLELATPLPDYWDPWEDLSAGAEVYAIPVINEIDNDDPPMGFTYIKSNVYFSRLPDLNLDPVCASCIPDGVDEQDCHQIVQNGFCKGLMDVNGHVYCQGINLDFLGGIQSRAACSDNCPCPPTCRNRLAEGIQLPVKLVKTKNLGWSLHTMVPICAGSYIMQYVGEIVCRSEMAAREHRYDKLGMFNYCMEAVEMERRHDDWQMPCLDSMILGNIARFLNHSCEPNVDVVTVWRGDDFPCIGVYALKNINAGEALTYCYGSSYKSIPCLCGTKSCRGFIGTV